MNNHYLWVVADNNIISGYFQTKEEAINKANEIINIYRQEAKFSEWDKDVEYVKVLKITHITKESIIQYSDTDEEEYNELITDFKLTPIKEK